MEKKIVIKGYVIGVLLLLNIILPTVDYFNQSVVSSGVLGSSTDSELYSDLYSDFELWGRYFEIEQSGGNTSGDFYDEWNDVENSIKKNDLYTGNSHIKSLANDIFNSNSSIDFNENLHALDSYVGECVDAGNCIDDDNTGNNNNSNGTGGNNSNNSSGGEQPARLPGMVDILARILPYVYPIAGIISIIFLIVGGYMWMVSAGDPAKVKQAQGTLTWAVVGLVFTLLCFAILRTIVGYIE